MAQQQLSAVPDDNELVGYIKYLKLWKITCLKING